MRRVLAFLLGCLFFVPLYMALVNVFKQGHLIAPSPASLPIPPTLANIQAVLERPDQLFWVSLANSLIVTSLSIGILTVLSAMLGHYLARTNNRWNRWLTLLLLSGLMIPPQVILKPIVDVLRTVELEESAAIDGATRMQIFWRIVFPLLRPATASVLIFLGVWIWNDFLNPLIILGPSRGTTITTGIYRSIGQYQQDFGALFAFMFLATLPVLIFFLLLQKQFVKGLTGGATKG